VIQGLEVVSRAIERDVLTTDFFLQSKFKGETVFTAVIRKKGIERRGKKRVRKRGLAVAY
jgi:hypothetical protein